MKKASVVLVAAGRSRRFKNAEVKKTFAILRNEPVWLHSAKWFHRRQDVQQIIVVISPDDETYFRSNFEASIKRLNIEVAFGGDERSDSVENGLRVVEASSEFVMIHDAARPCIDAELIERVFAAAILNGAAIAAVPIHSTIKRSLDGESVFETVDRAGLYLAQTPQIFRRELILDLYAKRNGVNITDEAQLAERHGIPVTLVLGSPLNLKITTQSDLRFAAAALDLQGPIHFDAPIDPSTADPRFH